MMNSPHSISAWRAFFFLLTTALAVVTRGVEGALPLCILPTGVSGLWISSRSCCPIPTTIDATCAVPPTLPTSPTSPSTTTSFPFPFPSLSPPTSSTPTILAANPLSLSLSSSHLLFNLSLFPTFTFLTSSAFLLIFSTCNPCCCIICFNLVTFAVYVGINSITGETAL
ncbi:hypothetical protein ABW19_dt0208573 [Dactylella cylindrospora]|nr:hypothetical protein ABW19_dt0208573 [Dactylella cylindrospora]